MANRKMANKSVKNRRALEKQYGELYTRHFKCDQNFCFYCGDVMNCIDHSPPLKAFDTYNSSYFNENEIPLTKVPCCNRCNMKLGSKMLLTIEERLDFLEISYESELNRLKGLWSDDEIEQMGRGLKDYIVARKAHQRLIIDKIRGVQSRIVKPYTFPKFEKEEL